MTHKQRLAINLVVVGLLAVVMVAWVLLKIVGGGISGGPFTVSAEFSASGGVFTNQEVTYRGVLIGKVGDMTLTDDGVRIEMLIDQEWDGRIPADVDATVRNKSAVGEQYINLTPLGTSNEMLAEGGSIPRERTHLPVDFQELLQSLDLVLADVDPEQAGSVVEELADGLKGRAEDIGTILESLGTLSDAFADVGPEQKRLLDNATEAGDAFLRTKDNFSAAIRAADSVLAGIGDEPEELRDFFAANDLLAREGIDLLAKYADDLASGIEGLADLSTFQLENREEMVIKTLRYIPQFLKAVEDASIPWRSPDGREFYRIRIGLVYDNVRDSWPCKYVVPEDYERFPHVRDERTPLIPRRCEPPSEDDQSQLAVASLVRALERWADANPEALAAALAQTEISFGEPGSATTENGFVWPLDGFVTSYFGPRDDGHHAGIDIDGVTGDPVRSAGGGRVVTAGFDDGGYGNVVVIDHGDGIATMYAHLSAIEVQVGDVLEQGVVLGAVGCTGSCTGDHLHFEVRLNGHPVDPLPYLPGGALFAGRPSMSSHGDFGG